MFGINPLILMASLRPGRSRYSWLTSILRMLSCLLFIGAGSVQALDDGLDDPSVKSDRASRSLLLDISTVGDRLIVVGERGHILYSDDQGQSWVQAEVPARVTLTAIHFPDSVQGWAVGHDGIVLSSSDRGESWAKLLDGYQANTLTQQGFQQTMEELSQRIALRQGDDKEQLEIQLEELEILADDAQAFVEEGASRPFLDLWFKNDREGFVIGAFGLMLHTKDGGRSWRSVAHRLNNPDGLHLNAIERIGSALFIAAEAGGLFRSLDDGESWEALELAYDGSLSGVVGGTDSLIAFGLRGNVFRSTDLGDRWHRVDAGVDDTLSDGILLEDGRLLLVGYAGTVLVSRDEGENFSKFLMPHRLPFSAVVSRSGQALWAVGFGGVHAIDGVSINRGNAQ